MALEKEMFFAMTTIMRPSKNRNATKITNHQNLKPVILVYVKLHGTHERIGQM